LAVRSIKTAELEKREQQDNILRAVKQAKGDEEMRDKLERSGKKFKVTAGARRQAEILWKKHFEPDNLEWEKRGPQLLE
jgi:UDP:flavonoid glycosyltransferase YjiC (YdhE family)